MPSFQLSAQAPDLTPRNRPGPVLWTSEESMMFLVPGRERGPVTAVQSSPQDSVQHFVSYDPASGTIVQRFSSESTGGRQWYHTSSVDGTGSYCVIAQRHLGPAIEYERFSKIRMYSTVSGELISDSTMNGEVYALSLELNRCIVMVQSEENGTGWYRFELRSIPTFETIRVLPQSAIYGHWYFDEHHGVLYSSRSGRVKEFDAQTGALLREFGFPYDGPVRRVKGTDTLLAVGVEENVSDYVRFGLIDMTNKRFEWLLGLQSPYWNGFFKHGIINLMATSDPSEISVTGITSSKPEIGRLIEILEYSIQNGLRRFCSGRSETSMLQDNAISFGTYDAENNILLMGMRPDWNAAHSIVPVTTSLQQNDVFTKPTILVDGDVIRLISREPWEIVGCVDLQGRQIELLCAVSPCQSADVQHLSSGVYVARLQHGREYINLPFSVLR